LTGIPFTVGFLGKYFLVKPAWAIAQTTTLPGVSGKMGWLVVILMVNAAVSAAYYLRIVASMFLRHPERQAAPSARPEGAALFSTPAAWAVALSVAGTLAFFLYIPAANALTARARLATQIQQKGDVPPIISASAN
jgi:NADH:ubiquinone oxidoreductase subunit 2 (subunit N)